MGADRQSFFNPRSTPRVELCQSHINAYCSPCRRNINIALNRNTKLTVVLVAHDEQVALAVLEYTPFSQRINICEQCCQNNPLYLHQRAIFSSY
jgi:hypothetical protein